MLIPSFGSSLSPINFVQTSDFSPICSSKPAVDSSHQINSLPIKQPKTNILWILKEYLDGNEEGIPRS